MKENLRRRLFSGGRKTFIDGSDSSPQLLKMALVEHSHIISPGPDDQRVLYLQSSHRSTAIWEGSDPGSIKVRHHYHMAGWTLDDRVRHYIIQAGLYGPSRLGTMNVDWALITALVERWRQETHTFHLAVGEATVTLQDVAVLLGLRIDGPPITTRTLHDLPALCHELLGVQPDPSALSRSSVKLNWLRARFGTGPPVDATDEVVRHYARGYILALFGHVLFVDKSGDEVRLSALPLLRDFAQAGLYSWGSAVLACLYRELCRATRATSSEIAGPIVLLQTWAWERLHVGRPDRLLSRDRGSVEDKVPPDPLACRWQVPLGRRDNPSHVLTFYRDELDRQRDEQFVWKPYMVEVLSQYPDVARDNKLWLTISPLIYFEVVEWYRPDRVMRQFGLRQQVPQPCDTSVSLHATDRRGRSHIDWSVHHAALIGLWEARWQTLAIGTPETGPMRVDDPYMTWYRSITRRFITPPLSGSSMRFNPTTPYVHALVRLCAEIYTKCEVALPTIDSELAKIRYVEIQSMIKDELGRLNLSHLLHVPLEAPFQGPRPRAPKRSKARRQAGSPKGQDGSVLGAPMMATPLTLVQADTHSMMIVATNTETRSIDGTSAHVEAVTQVETVLPQSSTVDVPQEESSHVKTRQVSRAEDHVVTQQTTPRTSGDVVPVPQLGKGRLRHGQMARSSERVRRAKQRRTR